MTTFMVFSHCSHPELTSSHMHWYSQTVLLLFMLPGLSLQVALAVVETLRRDEVALWEMARPFLTPQPHTLLQPRVRTEDETILPTHPYLQLVPTVVHSPLPPALQPSPLIPLPYNFPTLLLFSSSLVSSLFFLLFTFTINLFRILLLTFVSSLSIYSRFSPFFPLLFLTTRSHASPAEGEMK